MNIHYPHLTFDHLMQRFSFTVLSFFLCLSLKAQNGLNGMVPLDPQVRHGKLRNGFTYYIRNIDDDRVVMKLAMKVGHANEDSSQLELAHLLEHMAFRKTKHYNHVVHYFESKGLKWGSELNAHTALENTIYQFITHKDSVSIIRDGLLLIRDWCNGIDLAPDQIDLEREVVIAERRRGEDYLRAFTEHHFASTIGKLLRTQRTSHNIENNLRTFQYNSLYQFYNDWYRPDLQALIIVGNINIHQMEIDVKSYFSKLTNPTNPKQSNDLKDTLSTNNQLITFSHHKINAPELHIYIKQNPIKTRTLADLKLVLIGQLFNRMIEQRLEKQEYSRGNKYESLSIQFHKHLPRHHRLTSGLSANATLANTDIRSAFMYLMSELEKVKRHGFSHPEFLEAKQFIKRRIQTTEILDAEQQANKYVWHFLYSEAAPGLPFRQLSSHLFEGISLSELNHTIKSWIIDKDIETIILAPNEMKDAMPDEETVLVWRKQIIASTIKPFEPEPHQKHLSSLLPNGIDLKPQNRYHKSTKRVGITEITMSNGVKVILKPLLPTNGLLQETVQLHAFKPGGTSLYGPVDYASAKSACEIVANSGLGSLNYPELARYMDKNGVRIKPYMGKNEEGFIGSANPTELETLLQLVYLYSTAPLKNSTAFEEWRMRERQKAKHTKTPEEIFKETILANAYRIMPEKVDIVENADFGKAFRIYSKRFSNANGYTFIITGNFDLEKSIPLIVKYLGSLRSKRIRTNPHNAGSKVPTEKTIKTVVTGSNVENANVQLRFTGTAIYNMKDQIRLQLLSSILETILLHRLREQEGIIYLVGTSAHLKKSKPSQYAISISYTCDRDYVKRSILSTLNEIENLRTNGPDPSTLQKAKLKIRRQHTQALQDNYFWLTYLIECYRTNTDPDILLEHDKLLTQITERDIKVAARQYLIEDAYKQFVMIGKPSPN